MDTVLIFAGGETIGRNMLDDLPRPDLVVAADSGYDAAVALGFAVDVLVGDLDSLVATEIPDHVLVERHRREKDETDLELALSLTMRDRPLRIVVVGGSGGRFDHELANTLLLCSDAWDPVEIDWISARGRSYVIHGRRLIHADIGATLSLIPVGGDALGVTTSGLRWDLREENLLHGLTRGVSNEMKSPVADIRVDHGCLLAVLPLV